MTRPSVMVHQFSQVPAAEIPRSTFDRSHGLKTTFDASDLIPIYVDEALPGDTFNLKMTGFARLATPLKPIMDNMFMETFFFAVPIRIIWDNWQRFNGEETDPGDSTDFLVPQYTQDTYPEGSVADYMGVPTGVPITVNALHGRAYRLIFDEWFRDQNLRVSAPVPKDDGPDPSLQFTTVLKRGKRHDYFTSALPWPQKGDEVPLPLGDLAPVIGIGVQATAPNFLDVGPVSVRETSFDTEGLQTYDFVRDLSSNTIGITYMKGNIEIGGTAKPEIYADLSEATAATINEIRQAFQIQRLQERDARGGTRYTEIIKAHFGVSSPDARLQRPEFLGGGTSMVNINPVEQTSDQLSGGPGAETPQGNLAAFGTATLRNHGFTQSFTEHCVIIGLVNVRADLTYQQGLDRMFSRQTRFDYYWPALSVIGEQAILNKEIFADGSPADEEVFGYQERYAEYRYKPSRITGKFRSNDPASLDVWHLSQDFANLPVLGQQFIEEDVPIDRVIAVQSEPHFLFDAYFKLTCARPMPVYGVPGMIDHF